MFEIETKELIISEELKKKIDMICRFAYLMQLPSHVSNFINSKTNYNFYNIYYQNLTNYDTI
jgi:hypothetical protein